MMEQNGSTPQQEQTTKLNSRRKFLTRAGTGALIASLPAKSVWATNVNGLANSIVASGNTSDFAGGNAVKVQGAEYWKANKSFLGSFKQTKFVDIFHNNPIINGSMNNLHNKTISNILHADPDSKLAGKGNINHYLVSVYLSAKYSESALFDVYFPVVGPSKPFASLDALAVYLYGHASASPLTLATELDDLIT